MSGLWSGFWFKSFRKFFRKIVIFRNFDHWSEILSLSADRPISQDVCPPLVECSLGYVYLGKCVKNMINRKDNGHLSNIGVYLFLAPLFVQAALSQFYLYSVFMVESLGFRHVTVLKLSKHAVRVYGLIYDYVTLFTWYGHKILVYTVLTVVISDLALWLLRNPETARSLVA